MLCCPRRLAVSILEVLVRAATDIRGIRSFVLLRAPRFNGSSRMILGSVLHLVHADCQSRGGLMACPYWYSSALSFLPAALTESSHHKEVDLSLSSNPANDWLKVGHVFRPRATSFRKTKRSTTLAGPEKRDAFPRANRPLPTPVPHQRHRR